MLPPLLGVEEIRRRLLKLFPEGTAKRSYVTRVIAARTIFVMLYIGALEGSGTWLAPKHVCDKVIQRDDALARDIGLHIESDKLLPDMILVDLAPSEPLLVFVEAVASDGAIAEERRAELLGLTAKAGFRPNQLAFVTAFQDRSHPAFKRAVADLAWGSFAWCVGEPDHLIAFDGAAPGGVRRLSDFGATPADRKPEGR